MSTMTYLVIKQLHMALALVSIAGFLLRWTWRMRESTLASIKAAKILPHIIDTLLLATALLLLYLAGGSPLGTAWLVAKVGGLLAYIVLGVIAMRTAPVLSRSLPAFIAALLTFAWILSVAFSKSPLGFARFLVS